MMKNKSVATALVALSMLAAGAMTPAGAHAEHPARFDKAEDAIKYRQASFTILANHMGRLSAMAKGKVPFDAKAAGSSAQLIGTLSHLPWEAFPPGSDGGRAKVKGDPWKNAAEFQDLQTKFKEEAGRLAAASASLDTLKKQLGATGLSCKNCHEKFREK